MSVSSDPWISSLIPLLEKLSSFKKSNSQYSLVGSPTSESWSNFLESTHAVNTFMVIGLHDTPTISKATLLRLARELKGEPLFPSLRHLKIEIHSSACLDHLPLLISPSLQYVHLEQMCIDPSEDSSLDLMLATNAFISDLTTQPMCPNITTFIMNNYPQIPISWLDPLCNLASLRVLKLAHLFGVRSISDLVPLGRLEGLESLSLEMAHDESKTVSHRHRGDGDYNRITFRSLKELNLSAPLELIQGFLVYPEPPLANLVLNSAAWPENHYYGGYPSSFQLYLPDSVRNIHLTLGPDTHQSWRYPQNIESLHIHGGRRYSINGLNRYLDSLDVRSANVTLGDLAALLKSAPFLKDIALPFPICYPPDKPTYLPHHPLKKLTILKPVDSRSESGHTIVRIASPEPTPMPLTEVARFLDLLAPSLETLTAEGGDKTWDSIFRIIKLCQEVRSVNETGVEARACIF